MPAVEKLTDTLRAVETPKTSPQDRQGVIESIEQLTTALAAINARGTPAELREQLIVLVKQVTSTLEVGRDASVPAEERSMLILVVKRTTSTLDMICDPKTPQKLRGHLIAIVMQGNDALKRSQGAKKWRWAMMPMSASADIIHGYKSPRKQQKELAPTDRDQEELAETTHRVSSLVQKINDPRTSQEDKAKATEDAKKQTARMKEQQKKVAATQEQPDDPLGKAAETCTNAIFDSTLEHDLSKGLKELTPEKWNSEGVKDFWKSKEQGDERLDILAQLRNDERTHAPFEITSLIIKLADILPESDLFANLGMGALYCQKTAAYLDERGVTAGSWADSGDE